MFCGGLHSVWAIYQVLFYETSELYREHLKKINATKFPDQMFERFMFSQRMGLLFTVIMWYVGVMIGCYVAGYYLVRVVQKKNIYVSNCVILLYYYTLHILLMYRLSFNINHTRFQFTFQYFSIFRP